MAGRSLFIADLHLCESRPAVTRQFYEFLRNVACHADALYILGDLFEAWVGDDDLASPLHAETASHLHKLSGSGVPVFFMHGNRDFLLARRYADLAGMALIADPSVIDLYGVPTLLVHGDTLCTDDIAYLAFRGQVRNPDWQRNFLAQPLAARKAMAQQARAQSEAAKQGKSDEIMDVNAEEVERVLRSHAYPRLIHGHTHRPARHAHQVDGHDCERWVLPDWYARWGYLACDINGCELVIRDLAGGT
jgi:UDP-2,3-diacylglucosamine hydrolase